MNDKNQHGAFAGTRMGDRARRHRGSSLRAQFFTLDALFGGALLLIGLLALSRVTQTASHSVTIENYAQDTITALSTITGQELYAQNNSFIVQEVQNGNITDLNRSVLEIAGDYWAMGQQAKASQLITMVVAGTIPAPYGVSISAENDALFSQSIGTQTDIATSRRMIAGIAKSQPITGSASSAYLRKINNKRTASYIYFGGFTGQGNFTVFIDNLPADVNGSTITDMTLQGDSASNFTLFVNSLPCNFSALNQSFAIFSPPVGVNLTPAVWNITLCNSSIIAGRNNFTLLYTSNLSSDYMAGGFIRISYRTNTLVDNYTAGSLRYYFPDITGLINLFDSFYVPGALTGINAYMHLQSNYSSYLTIGNAAFTFNGSNQSQWINVTNDSIVQSLGVRGLNYSSLSLTTVPLKVGIGTVVLGNGVSETMMVTDTSGSMSGSYMDVNGFGRWSGYAFAAQYKVNLSANGQYNYSFNLTNPGFAYDSIGVNATALGAGGHVQLFVTAPGAAEVRAQCSSDRPPCNAVGNNDVAEFYYRDNPVNGTYRIRVVSSSAQNISVGISLSKIDLARSADDLFTDILLNASGPLVGLAEYSDSIKSGHNLSLNKSALMGQINSYDASGGTCICCGILNATAELTKDGQFNLINRGDYWAYNDSNLAAQPVNFTNFTFRDSSWRQGYAPLGNGTIPGYPPNLATTMRRYTGYYYLRHAFNVSNTTSIADLQLNLYYDSGVQVWLNDVRVYNDLNAYDTAAYWTAGGIEVNRSLLKSGDNVLAVRLRNRNNCNFCGTDNGVGFDAQLTATRSGNAAGILKTIVLMTDGQANVDCSSQLGNTVPDYNGDGNTFQDPVDQAIYSACSAYANYGIITDAVGLGYDADQRSLQMMANATCGHGKYYNATNITGLMDVFQGLANTVITNSGTQTLLSLGAINATRLYGDSYLDIAYDPITAPPQPNELSVRVESSPLGGCNGSVSVPAGVRVTDAQMTSYSGAYWTDGLFVNGQSVYNLSIYSSIFTSLGDPFIIQVPPTMLLPGANNNISMEIGFDPLNDSACSLNNTLIFTALVNSSTSRSGVSPAAVGCHWLVQFDDGSFSNITIPTSYIGPAMCNYTNMSISYNASDAYQVALAELFQQLDFNKDGRVLVNIGSEDLEIIVTLVGQVPYMWGPSLFTVDVWR